MPGRSGHPRGPDEPLGTATPGGITGSTRLVGLIGWPVDHTLSPAVHNAAFAALGLDWAYVPLPVEPDAAADEGVAAGEGRLGLAVRGLGAAGFAGANVTMPYKEGTVPVMAELTDDAAALRAVNTIEFRAGTPVGHNTDARGFERFLAEDAAFDATGRSALVLGAGGAARACALALARAGASSVAVAARDADRGADAAEIVAAAGADVHAVAWPDAADVRADVVVNATPLADPASIPLPPLGPGTLVVDLRYQPPVTPLVAAAREAGAAGFGGLGMLIHQAALSFELWTGRVPPAGVMSAAALAAMAEPLV